MHTSEEPIAGSIKIPISSSHLSCKNGDHLAWPLVVGALLGKRREELHKGAPYLAFLKCMALNMFQRYIFLD
jgi:hypothetical protein